VLVVRICDAVDAWNDLGSMPKDRTPDGDGDDDDDDDDDCVCIIFFGGGGVIRFVGSVWFFLVKRPRL